MKLNNKYYILRHGEAKSNVEDVVSCWPEKFSNPLTEKGVAKINKVVKELQNKKIDLIFASPLLRTKQTAEIVADKLNLKVKFDMRLREVGFGALNGGSAEKFDDYFKSFAERIKRKTKGGENYTEVFKRVSSLLTEINRKYKNKNILIVSHQLPLLLLRVKAKGHLLSESTEALGKDFRERIITKGQLIELN